MTVHPPAPAQARRHTSPGARPGPGPATRAAIALATSRVHRDRPQPASSGRSTAREDSRDRRAARLALARAATFLRTAGHAPLSSSLSHRDGRGLAGVAPAGVRIGVDLEREGTVRAGEAAYFLTEREREAAQRIPADLTTFWVLKEASWKLLRLGPEVPFHALELFFDGHGELDSLAIGKRGRPVWASWWRPWRGYLAGVVWSVGASEPAAAPSGATDPGEAA